MIISKDGKIIGVILNNDMKRFFTMNQSFRESYQGMLDKGINSLERAESPEGTFATKIVHYQVGQDTLGIVVGELESLGYRVKM